MIKRSSIFLFIHAVILMSLFVLRLSGVAADIILLVAAAVISMEAIYMAVFTKEAVSGTCRSVKEMEKEIAVFKETVSQTIKLERALLYTGHQIKNIQQELDILKKKTDFKVGGNGHTRRLQHPLISRS